MITLSDARVKLEFDGTLAVITLARPEKLNALDRAMVAALAEAADKIEHQSELRVAILTGEGGKAFSAGGDIAAWADEPAVAFHRHWIRDGHRAFDALARLRVPLIAVLNGAALGGGLELAATADFRIAESQARIALPETTLGMVPGWSGTQRLVRRFGPQTVRRMSLGAEVFSASEALALGLVDKVVEPGHGMGEARAYAARIAALGPIAVETAKLMINAAEQEETSAAIESLAGGLVARTGDLREGVAAFRQKRPIVFDGA
ncbi:MAG: enoyl-CoA hydratase/isomerase family protein [Rhizobiales bacterium]|nr:enoyl-CoA hydratase/isomerase family protein [Hyphomicrobiales bacterium]MBI3674709.1 enoyl-CoA hydratase/isomerase family protein [Hyphomicrobiales bacterium]